jgi:hypothetical protein
LQRRHGIHHCGSARLLPPPRRRHRRGRRTALHFQRAQGLRHPDSQIRCDIALDEVGGRGAERKPLLGYGRMSHLLAACSLCRRLSRRLLLSAERGAHPLPRLRDRPPLHLQRLRVRARRCRVRGLLLPQPLLHEPQIRRFPRQLSLE